MVESHNGHHSMNVPKLVAKEHKLEHVNVTTLSLSMGVKIALNQNLKQENVKSKNVQVNHSH